MTFPEPPRSLPLLTSVLPGGGRSTMTCRYRCGDACFQDVPNTSDNAYFGDVVTDGLTRRSVLRAGTVGAAVLGLAL